MGKQLVILGADFSENSVPVKKLIAALTVCLRNSVATMRTSPNNGTVLMYKQGLNNTKWGIDSNADYADKANCALNEIPYGAKTIKATDTAKQKNISIALYNENYIGIFTPSWSAAGTYSQEINIAQYPTAKYFSLNYQQLPTDISTLTIEFTF